MFNSIVSFGLYMATWESSSNCLKASHTFPMIHLNIVTTALLDSLERQKPTTCQMRSSNAPTPTNLHLLDVIVLVSQVRLDLLDPRALAEVDADFATFVRRVENDNDVGAVFVDVSGAVEVIVAYSDAVGVGANETGEVGEGPGALGDFVLAVFDFDELLVVVAVCGFVLDDEPPVDNY